MTHLQLSHLSTYEMGEHIRSGSISPRDIAHDFLHRIDMQNTSLQAYTHVDPDKVLLQARQLESRICKSPKETLQLPLLGSTFCVSDFLIEMTNSPLSNGSSLVEPQYGEETALIIRRLMNLGALFLGRTHATEFSLTDIGETSHASLCRNPWQLNFAAGGPCGGGACAVASGLATFAVGPNIRGGCDLPAAYCGIFSLGLSRGKVPINTANELTLRPFINYSITARSIEDLATVTDAVSYPDPRDSESYPPYPYNHQEVLKKEKEAPYHLAWLPNLGSACPPESLEPLVKNFLIEIEEKGHSHTPEAVVEADLLLTHMREVLAVHLSLFLSQLPQASLENCPSHLAPWLAPSQQVSSGQYIFAKSHLHIFKQQLYCLLDRYDLLLLPAYTMECPHLDQPMEALDPILGLQEFIIPFSLTGMSRLMIPIGVNKKGLPVALQLIGREKEEGKLLHFAKHIRVEARTPPSLEDLLCSFNP